MFLLLSWSIEYTACNTINFRNKRWHRCIDLLDRGFRSIYVYLTIFPEAEVNSGTYSTESRSGKGRYFSLGIDTEGNNCFSTNPTNKYHFQKWCIVISWITSQTLWPKRPTSARDCLKLNMDEFLLCLTNQSARKVTFIVVFILMGVIAFGGCYVKGVVTSCACFFRGCYGMGS